MPYATYLIEELDGPGAFTVTVRTKINVLVEGTVLFFGILLSSLITASVFWKLWSVSVQTQVVVVLAAPIAYFLVVKSTWNLCAFDVLEFGNGTAVFFQWFGPVLLRRMDIQGARLEIAQRVVTGGRQPRTEFTLEFRTKVESRRLNFGFESAKDAECLAEHCEGCHRSWVGQVGSSHHLEVDG